VESFVMTSKVILSLLLLLLMPLNASCRERRSHMLPEVAMLLKMFLFAAEVPEVALLLLKMFLFLSLNCALPGAKSRRGRSTICLYCSMCAAGSEEFHRCPRSQSHCPCC
jgi:hypothetical protein